MPSHKLQCIKAEANHSELVRLPPKPPHEPSKKHRSVLSETKSGVVEYQQKTQHESGRIKKDSGRDDCRTSKAVGSRRTGFVFPSKRNISLREIGRLAAADGLTAKEAAEKYGINKYSLRKVLCRYKMPQLITEQERAIVIQVSNMTDQQLKNYSIVLSLPKNKDVSSMEKEYVTNEIQRRGIT